MLLRNVERAAGRSKEQPRAWGCMQLSSENPVADFGTARESQEMDGAQWEFNVLTDWHSLYPSDPNVLVMEKPKCGA